MAGRLLIGPALRLWIMVTRETGRVRRGDYSHLPHWGVHVVAVGLLFWFISGVCKFMVAVLACSSPTRLESRSVARVHRTSRGRGLAEAHRGGGIERRVRLLYLYNNLHVVHHLKPPWVV